MYLKNTYVRVDAFQVVEEELMAYYTYSGKYFTITYTVCIVN